ncbi:MAG: family 1 encapsulin nanocompartment shell protein [Vulcanimicrobiota bacterium]
MANKYLTRDDAFFDNKAWHLIDNVMIESAKSQMVGRKLLKVKGPYGLGLKVVPLKDEEIEEGISMSSVLPVLYINRNFTLNKRDLAAFEHEGVPLDTSSVSEAAIWCARSEDDIIFNGKKNASGLLNIKGANKVSLMKWEDVGAAANDIINAVTKLDEAGFHGPYTMALSPERYNQLYRRYPRGHGTEMEHLKTIVTDGIYKAPVLKKGGVLLASGEQYVSIVLGQDMFIGFTGPAEDQVEFTISESLALRVTNPKAIMVLNG